MVCGMFVKLQRSSIEVVLFKGCYKPQAYSHDLKYVMEISYKEEDQYGKSAIEMSLSSYFGYDLLPQLILPSSKGFYLL